MTGHMQISRGGNIENNDSDAQSEFEEVFVEIDPVYIQNYLPMTNGPKIILGLK